MNEEIVAQVRSSYGRCTTSKGFFGDFYDEFLSRSPEIGEKFKNTNMENQQIALKNGLGMLILFAKGNHHMATRKINDLSASHSKARLDIKPEFYLYWISSLLKTIEKHDAKFNPELKQSWEKLLQVGVDEMVSKYRA